MKGTLSFIILLFLAVSGFGQAFKILVFTKTAGFQHASIPDGIIAINALALQNNFAVDNTDDASVFTTTSLSQYAAVVFLNTTGDVLNSSEEAAFEQYIQSGGGFVGIHSASDTEYGWAWYGGLIGRYFVSHPDIQSATLQVENSSHPSTKDLPGTFQFTDEWYNFATPFPAHLNVLITVDEATYSGGTMGSFHPISWYHLYDGGRSFYTAMGHTSEAYADSQFRQHLLGGIMWAANTTINVGEFRDSRLFDLYPNPSRDKVNIAYSLESNSEVCIEIIDHSGKILNTLLNASQPKGDYHLEINHADLKANSPANFVKVSLNEKSFVRQIIKIK